MTALRHVLEAGVQLGAELTLVKLDMAQVRWWLPRASGEATEYHLELAQIRAAEVTAREQTGARRLPACCPERHINHGGSFCLYWAEHPAEVLRVMDAASALDWWRVLMEFLRRQEVANRMRKWPGEARAHGDAARYQARAEQLAVDFGPKFRSDVRNGAFTVKPRTKHGRKTLQLSRGSQVIARVGPAANGAIDASLRCPCDTSANAQTIAQCGAHRRQLKEFILAVERWHTQEREFNETLRADRVPCCQTMDVCPLRK